MDPTFLPAEQRVALDSATRYRTWQIVAQLVVALTGVVSVLTDNHQVLYALACAGTAGLGVWLWLDHAGRDRREAGERFRRATLVVGGLGQLLAASEQLMLADASKASEKELQKVHDPAYYASSLSAGPARVAEMLEESAFWTAKLQAVSARYMTGGCAVLAVLTVVAGVLIIPRATTEDMVTFIARCSARSASGYRVRGTKPEPTSSAKSAKHPLTRLMASVALRPFSAIILNASFKRAAYSGASRRASDRRETRRDRRTSCAPTRSTNPDGTRILK